MIPVLSPQHATLDREHTAEELELRDDVAIYAVNVVAMEIRDERLDRAIEASERMRPVVLADCGNLVVSRAEIDEFALDRRDGLLDELRLVVVDPPERCHPLDATGQLRATAARIWSRRSLNISGSA